MNTTHQTAPLLPIGQLLKQSWAEYRDHWKTYIKIIVGSILVTVAPLAAVLIVAAGVTALSLTIGEPNLAITIIKFILAALGLMALIGLLVIAILSQIVWYLMILSPTLRLRALFQQARPFFWPMLWLEILTGFIVVGLVPFLIIPALVMTAWLSFAVWVLFVENGRGLNAVVMSREYVRGRFWPVVGRLMLWFVITIALSIVLTMLPFISQSAAAYVILQIINVVVSIFVLTPFGYIYTLKIYQELKHHRGSVEVTPKQRKIYGGLALWGVVAAILMLIFFVIILPKYIPANLLTPSDYDDTYPYSDIDPEFNLLEIPSVNEGFSTNSF